MKLTLLRWLKKPFFGSYVRPFKWPDGVDREEWTPVQFENPVGARLAGLHAKARNQPTRGIAVFPHPFVRRAKGWCLTSGHADLLLDAGFDVMTFDLNGFGDSEDGGVDYPGDIRAAGHRAAELAPGQPVVLLAASLGAGHGLSAMDDDRNPFRAAILDSPFTTLGEFWGRYFVLGKLLKVLEVTMPKTALMLRPIARAPRIRDVERILIIYGDSDEITPPSMGDRFMEALPLPRERKQIWIVPGAEHIKAIEVAADEYRERVLAVLDEVASADAG